MPWSKIDDNFYDHPKVVAVGPLGIALFVCGLSYSARHLTDGFISKAQARRLCDLDDPIAVADSLVSVGLWDKAEGGYRIHDYLDYNPSAASVKAKRDSDAKRQARHRDSQGRYTVTNGVTNGVTHVAPVPVPVPEEQRQEESSFVESAMQAYTNTIGLVSGGNQRDEIVSYLDDLQKRNATDWWAGALKIAADQNHRSWAYVRGVLKKCLAEGHPPSASNGYRRAERVVPKPTEVFQ